MPNENENTSNELDALFTTSDSSEGDDFFSLGDENAEATGDSSSFDGSVSVDIEVEANPFETSDSSSIIDSFDASNSSDSPFGTPPTEDSTDFVPVAPTATEETGKKGKKAKGAKKEKAPKKEKVAKEPKAKGAKKEKAPKEPKAPKGPKVKRPYVVSPFPFFVLLFVLILVVACIVVAAFAIGGGGAVAFLVPAGVLAIVMLAVPFMLISHLRIEPVGLFDMFLALATIFVVLSAIAILAYQAKTYGSSSKVVLNAPAVVASFDC